jgi:2'-5' RNA ligase
VRLFVALEIPAAVRDNLTIFLNDMRKLCDQLAEKRIRWVRPENLHVTLKFVGEVADTKLDALRAALLAVQCDAPLDLGLRRLGFFPNEKRPGVLWSSLDASTNLRALATDIDRALALQGIEREKRPFVPHLTLARFSAEGLHGKLLAAIRENGKREFGSFQAREFHLIQSTLKPTGAEYTTLTSFPVTTET